MAATPPVGPARTSAPDRYPGRERGSHPGHLGREVRRFRSLLRQQQDRACRIRHRDHRSRRLPANTYRHRLTCSADVVKGQGSHLPWPFSRVPLKARRRSVSPAPDDCSQWRPGTAQRLRTPRCEPSGMRRRFPPGRSWMGRDGDDIHADGGEVRPGGTHGLDARRTGFLAGNNPVERLRPEPAQRRVVPGFEVQLNSCSAMPPTLEPRDELTVETAELGRAAGSRSRLPTGPGRRPRPHVA